MTTNNYTCWTNQQIAEFVQGLGKSSKSIFWYLRDTYPELIDIVLERTNFLTREYPFIARIYCLEHNITTQPMCRCQGCGKVVSWRNHKFSEYCSSKCAHSDPLTYEKTKLTCKLKYGCENPGQSDKAKEQRKQTNLSRYGVENTFQGREFIEKIKQTNLERYGVEHPMQCSEIQERHKKSIVEKYGVEFATQSEIVKDKMRQTWLANYGVDHPAKCKEIQDRIRQTNLERYGVECSFQIPIVKELLKQLFSERFGTETPLESEEVRNKGIKTSHERYGVDYPMQSEFIKEKFKQTCLERYGVENPWMLESIQQKSRFTSIIKYGTLYPTQSNEIQQKTQETCIAKYGVPFALQSKEVKEKIRKTNQLRYGVDYYSQTKDFHKYRRKHVISPKYPSMTFDSSWELKLFEFCKDNGIDIEYQPDTSIPYEYKGTSHTYHPDFLINGKLYEVKGDHFFRFNESTGKEEMYCPFRNPNWSDEEYSDKCGLCEAKHQCMLSNSVIILRDSNLQNLSVDIFI